MKWSLCVQKDYKLVGQLLFTTLYLIINISDTMIKGLILCLLFDLEDKQKAHRITAWGCCCCREKLSVCFVTSQRALMFNHTLRKVEQSKKKWMTLMTAWFYRHKTPITVSRCRFLSDLVPWVIRFFDGFITRCCQIFRLFNPFVCFRPWQNFRRNHH